MQRQVSFALTLHLVDFAIQCPAAGCAATSPLPSPPGFELPLPLGGNAVRRDLGEQTMRELTRVLLRSIRWALEHRRESVKYALQFSLCMETDLADRFVDMYVNKWTLDYGADGRRAVQELLRRGQEVGMVPAVDEIEFIA